jgi:hypothetical protein
VYLADDAILGLDDFAILELHAGGLAPGDENPGNLGIRPEFRALVLEAAHERMDQSSAPTDR